MSYKNQHENMADTQPKILHCLIKISCKNIFEAFQWLHGCKRCHETGSGGPIVKKVVQKHQGLMALKGDPGNGANFTILHSYSIT